MRDQMQAWGNAAFTSYFMSDYVVDAFEMARTAVTWILGVMS